MLTTTNNSISVTKGRSPKKHFFFKWICTTTANGGTFAGHYPFDGLVQHLEPTIIDHVQTFQDISESRRPKNKTRADSSHSCGSEFKESIFVKKRSLRTASRVIPAGGTPHIFARVTSKVYQLKDPGRCRRIRSRRASCSDATAQRPQLLLPHNLRRRFSFPTAQ